MVVDLDDDEARGKESDVDEVAGRSHAPTSSTLLEPRCPNKPDNRKPPSDTAKLLFVFTSVVNLMLLSSSRCHGAYYLQANMRHERGGDGRPVQMNKFTSFGFPRSRPPKESNN